MSLSTSVLKHHSQSSTPLFPNRCGETDVEKQSLGKGTVMRNEALWMLGGAWGIWTSLGSRDMVLVPREAK